MTHHDHPNILAEAEAIVANEADRIQADSTERIFMLAEDMGARLRARRRQHAALVAGVVLAIVLVAVVGLLAAGALLA